MVSIQIIDKSGGQYEVVRTVGSSSDPETIDRLFRQAKGEINEITGQQLINFEQNKERELVELFFHHIESMELAGPDLLLGKLFDEIGFHVISDDLFRHLVICRLVYPVSKLKTVDYLFKYKGISVDINSVYRYLDKLHESQIKQVQKVSYEHTLKLLSNQLSIVFYDVTTLYFEAADEDDLRKTGFSKDGKHQQPQIVLGLLVSEGGYPLDYEIFEGNTFEGKTMLPVIEAFNKKYNPGQLIIVADAGLMSNKNLLELCEKEYRFIIGARIKNETEGIKEKILELSLKDAESTELQKEDGNRLIISYSTGRAKKDAFNRKRGMTKLEKELERGKLTKKQINNKGYNKYLKLEGDITITIDYEKFKADERWDGLKGYITNTSLSKEQVIDTYKELWNIEKAFRISKTDLRIRPVYHHVKRRIEAHICIAFTACKIYKELERQLKTKKSGLSAEKAMDILKTIYRITITTPYSKNKYSRLVIKNEEQSELVELFNLEI
ncbi:IS1634 family transposase [Terrimonas pollutisoli]|uniref:IS1634 family transposase n=1 Tax=Terrimonas pollutisoli TaxID=3034147 RepID=UPI0023EB480A|nr:IS1634 family transposase [Terrimonas sp. H1YJ31]